MPHPPASRIDVVRTHLELRGPDALRLVPQPAGSLELERCTGITAGAYRALYTLIGGPWHWHDRLTWSDAQLDGHLASPAVHVWTLRIDGSTAGYFELQRHPDARVEIMYFGLARSFMGRGLGGWLLTRACNEAFAMGGTAVVLNTCTLDAPQALPNYLARGFTLVREERYTVDAPEQAAAPRPDAD